MCLSVVNFPRELNFSEVLRSRETGSAFSMHLRKGYAQRLLLKMREIFTNRLRDVSASINARAKCCLVKHTIL